MDIAKRIDLIHAQSKPLSEDELNVKILDRSVALPKDLSKEDVKRIWEAGLAENPRMSDKDRYFLNSIDGNTLECTLGNYSDFYATMKQKQAQESITEEQLEDYLNTGLSVLGLAIVYRSEEGDILLQKRSARVTQASGTYLMPSGGFMPDHFKEEEYPSPFEGARRQLYDEQRLRGKEGSLKYLGIVRDLIASENPTMVFAEDSWLSKSEIKECFVDAKDKYETDHLRFISSDPDSLLNTIRGNYVDSEGRKIEDGHILGVGLGALILYGNANFGNEWLEEARWQSLKNKEPETQSVRMYNPFKK